MTDLELLKAISKRCRREAKKEEDKGGNMDRNLIHELTAFLRHLDHDQHWSQENKSWSIGPYSDAQAAYLDDLVERANKEQL